MATPNPYREPPDVPSNYFDEGTTALNPPEAQRARKFMRAFAERSMEGLRLYEPLPYQLDFHRSQAKERLAIGSNRSGKTTATCVEISWAALGIHPHRFYPKPPLEIYLVAKDGRQIGEVWWQKLTGHCFDIIQESGTKMKRWRAFRPFDPKDVARSDERRSAGPLLPERLWDGEPAWEDKRLGIPKLLRLKNGTRIHFFTGNAKPPQGTAIHLAAFSEELGSQLWYPEIAVRLAQHNGDFVWDATPQAGGEGLYELFLRSEKEAGKENPKVTYHFMHIEKNPHISKEAKDTLLAKLTDPDQKRVRWDGQFHGSQLHIFPEWSAREHTGTLTKDGWVRGEDCKEPCLPIPKDWTRYAVIDPGHATCAALFAAVPPETFGDYIYIYDELYAQPCMSADHFAELFANKIQQDHFYEFVVDGKNARQTEVASGRTIGDQYADALEKRKIRSQITGSTLLWAMVDALAGNMAVHDWLSQRPSTNDAKLRVIRGRCPNFEFEIQRYRKKRKPDGTIDDKPYEKHDHLMTCLKYLRWRNPKWHKPVAVNKEVKTSYEQYKEYMAAKFGGQEDTYINLGPGRGSSHAA